VGGAQVATDPESTNQLQLAPGVATGQPADVTSLLSIAAHPRTVRCLLQRSAPIQLAQCRFHAWQAISNAKILILFFKWNIRKQFYQTALSETVMVWNYQNADCSLKRKFYLYIFFNFRQTFVPYRCSTRGLDYTKSKPDFMLWEHVQLQLRITQTIYCQKLVSILQCSIVIFRSVMDNFVNMSDLGLFRMPQRP